MVKIDFARKTVRLWPEEYKGTIRIEQNSLHFTNYQGIQNQITLPIGWSEGNGAITDKASSSSNLLQEDQQVHQVTTEKVSKAQEMWIGTILIDELKEKLEMAPDSISLLKRRIEDYVVKFEAMQAEQTKLSESLLSLDQRFTRNMGMIKSFADEIQNFVNKAERRVLRLDHIVLSPIEDLTIEDSGQKPSTREKTKAKR